MENSNLHNTIVAALEAEQQVKDAQINYENKLQAIVTENKGKTFQHEGMWFQVRKREGEDREISYLCALKDEPKTYCRGRPKGSVNKKKAVSLTVVPSSVAAQLEAVDAIIEAENTTVTDEGSTTVIDWG